MKLLITLFISLYTVISYGNATVLKVTTHEKMFNALIDGQYPVKMYLKYKDHSCCHEFSYSVEGWYSFEHLGSKKVVLTGFYHLGELYLYHFERSIQKSFYAGYGNGAMNFWDHVDSLRNIRHYKEKIVISTNREKPEAVWQNQFYSLPIKFFFPHNIEVYENKEYLYFDEKRAFDLANIPMWRHNFELVCQSSDSRNLILSYSHLPRPYVMGMCGAGQEKGYVYLEFGKDFELVRFHDYQIESCLDRKSLLDSHYEGNIIKHKVFNEENENESEIEINKVTCKINVNAL